MQKPLLLLIVFASLCAFAASEITSCGVVINQPGEYYLAGSLAAGSGNCLQVGPLDSPGKVSIDCQGHSLVDKGSAGHAVHVNADGFELTNCAVSGFDYGVFVDGASAASVNASEFAGQREAAVHLAGSYGSNASYNSIDGALAFDLLESSECAFQDNAVEADSFASLYQSPDNAFSGGSFTSTEPSAIDWAARLFHALTPGVDGSCVPGMCTIPPCPPACDCVGGYRDCSGGSRSIDLDYYSTSNSFDKIAFNGAGEGAAAVIQADSTSASNSFHDCGFGLEALVQSHGAQTSFESCEFEALAGLDLYGDYSKAIDSRFGAQGIVFYGANGKAAGLDAGGFVAFKGPGGYLADSLLDENQAYFLSPVPSADEFARVEGTTASKANLSNARVTWLGGSFEDAVFQDASSRLKREWPVTLEFEDALTQEPLEVVFYLSDSFGNAVYDEDSLVSSLELNLTEAVLSSGFAELRGSALRLSGFWDAGSHDPHSYSASAEGYEDASGEFASGSGVSIPIVLAEAMGGPSPSISPSVSAPPLPSGMPGSFFTIETPSSIVVDPQVSLFVDLVEDGVGVCSNELRLTAQLEGGAGVDEYAPDSCSGGRHVFTLALSTAGQYSLHAYGYAGYDAYGSLRVIGQPPQAVPDASLLTVVLAGALALYALRRGG